VSVRLGEGACTVDVSRRSRVFLSITFASMIVLILPQAAKAATGPGPYLTLLFSRSAVTASSNCVTNDTGVAQLDTVVAPALSSLGLRPTGSIETGVTKQDSLWCGHYKETQFTSWSLAEQLASQYGWSFVSHTSTYPYNGSMWSALSSREIYDETCGSAQQITAHGLPGANGSMAWPNGYVYDPATSDVQACFDFSRTFGDGVADQATATVPPYDEPARGLQGGACNDTSAACYGYTFAHAPNRYRSPVATSQLIASAQASQWITLQTYLLVTGSRAGLWDCTSPDWRQHWTYDTERYCWDDYLSIVSSIPASVTVTDPASVGAAWGRVAPGHLPITSVALSPAASTIEPATTQTYTIEGYDSLGNDLGDVTSDTTFTISGSGSCTQNACGSTDAGSYTVTGTVGGVSGTAQLTVGGATPTSIVVSPATATITTGSTQEYRAEGFDSLGTDLGDVTGQTTFSIEGGGSCVANACAASQPGTYTVTGTDGSASGTAQLSVVAALAVSSFSPASGVVGTSVTITGSGFSGATGVSFAGTTAAFAVSSSTQITTTVPAGATTGPITVKAPGGSATSAGSFSVRPSISGFTPTSGTVGTTVTINGSAFSGATDVRFNGTPATFTVVSYGRITATVPLAADTGKISVTAPSGTASSATNFQVKPTISGFSPASGPVGTVVTITGTGFAGTTALKFHTTAASFSILSPTMISATVPAGATSGAITVSTKGGTARSVGRFKVTR
jgi:hypothetical protein